MKSLILQTILKIILNTILITCKWDVYNKNIFIDAQKNNRPVFLCCWHSRFILIARYFKHIKQPIWSVSSTHKDSELMAGILRGWGLKLIRGSSTRGWSHVLKQLIILFKQHNSIVAITNDGPKGPPMVAKKGSLMVALKHNAQIISISGSASSFWTLPSWDKTIIPKPFSTIYIQFGQPFRERPKQGEEVKKVSQYITQNYQDLNNKH
tara:strand:+ start:5011 stop:5637 length:627 start_codon:yes stop_codon:yes gene_type:complete